MKMYDWMYISDALKQIILNECPQRIRMEFLNASHKWCGPLVMVHGAESVPEDHLPSPCLRRLRDSHDGRFTILREDVRITVWYNVCGGGL